MRTNMKFWPAKRMLCLALCILMLIGIAMPSFETVARDGKGPLLGRLFGVSEAYAAENDVTTWTASGTCEWGEAGFCSCGGGRIRQDGMPLDSA